MSLRFAVAGVGRIAQSHFSAIDEVEEAVLTAVVEPRKAAADPMVEEAGGKVRWFESHQDRDLPELVDAAIVCSPPSTHHAVAAHFLERGIAVLCEKPLDLSVAGAAKLFELAAANDTVLMMASKFRFCDDVAETKSLIESGKLGRILGYHNVFSGFVDMKNRWNATPSVAGGGVLMDNGTHSVDIARYLLGPIAAIQAEAGARGQDIDVEDTAHVLFRTESGVVGQIDLTWSMQRTTTSFIDVYGTEGTVAIGWQESRRRLAGDAALTPFGCGYDKNAAFRNQLHNFIDAVRGGAEPRVAPADAIASVAAIEAAYASLRHDKWMAPQLREGQ